MERGSLYWNGTQHIRLRSRYRLCGVIYISWFLWGGAHPVLRAFGFKVLRLSRFILPLAVFLDSRFTRFFGIRGFGGCGGFLAVEFSRKRLSRLDGFRNVWWDTPAIPDMLLDHQYSRSVLAADENSRDEVFTLVRDFSFLRKGRSFSYLL